MVAFRCHARQRLEEALDVRLEDGCLVGMVEAGHRRLGQLERAVPIAQDPRPGRRLHARDRPLRPGTGAPREPPGRWGRRRARRRRARLHRADRARPRATATAQRIWRSIRTAGPAVLAIDDAGHRGRVRGISDRADRRPQPERAQVALGQVAERVRVRPPRTAPPRPGGAPRARSGPAPRGPTSRAAEHDLVVSLRGQDGAHQLEVLERRVPGAANHLPERAPQELAQERVVDTRQHARDRRQRCRVEQDAWRSRGRRGSGRRGPAPAGPRQPRPTPRRRRGAPARRRSRPDRPPSTRDEGDLEGVRAQRRVLVRSLLGQLEAFDPAVARPSSGASIVLSEAVSSQRRLQSRSERPAPVLEGGEEVGQRRRCPRHGAGSRSAGPPGRRRRRSLRRAA